MEKNKELNKLKLTRILSGLTQLELEEKSGVLQCRISKHENGYADLNQKEKKALAGALNVELEEIFPEG